MFSFLICLALLIGGYFLYGKVVDVNNGLEGDGAYTAERPGSLAVVDVLRAAFSGKYDRTF